MFGAAVAPADSNGQVFHRPPGRWRGSKPGDGSQDIASDSGNTLATAVPLVLADQVRGMNLLLILLVLVIAVLVYMQRHGGAP